MRFLFVYQDYAVEARKLIKELAVNDVLIIVARKSERAPNLAELESLRAYPKALAAACEINRHYRKNVEQFVQFSYEPKKFRINDLQLRQWLKPQKTAEAAVSIACPNPKFSFESAAGRTHRLVLHPNALKHADELSQVRWSFASRAAIFLADYADGKISGALSEAKASHGIDFAANGKISFKYIVNYNDKQIRGKTSWHLKEGDNTSKVNAARVYFDKIELQKNEKRVLLFYVGPHPEEPMESEVLFSLLS